MADIETKNPKQYPMSLGQIIPPSLLTLSLQGSSGREKLTFINVITNNTNEINAIIHNNILVVESDVSFAKKRQPKE